MSKKFQYNEVTVALQPPVLSTEPVDIVRGAVYERKDGNGKKCFYQGVYARDREGFILTCLDSGNFWSHSTMVPKKFTRLAPGTEITIIVGE